MIGGEHSFVAVHTGSVLGIQYTCVIAVHKHVHAPSDSQTLAAYGDDECT